MLTGNPELSLNSALRPADLSIRSRARPHLEADTLIPTPRAFIAVLSIWSACALLRSAEDSVPAAPSPLVALTKEQAKQLEQLKHKLGVQQDGQAKTQAKLASAAAALLSAEAAVEAAAALPEATPAEQKAKQKAAKSAAKAAAKAAKKVAKWTAKLEQSEAKEAALTASIDQLDPWYFTGPGQAVPSQHDPAWASIEPTTVIALDRDPALSDQQNGALLKSKVLALQPGQRLVVGGGTWSVDSYFAVGLKGTAEAPISIVAKEGEVPVLTRPDAAQNLINIGGTTLDGAQFLCLRGFELTGGSAGVRLYSCNNVWIDRCEIHHVGEAALTANSFNTAELFLTRNHIHHTDGYGEGMYLGANNGTISMRDSIIARNHVHDTGGLQGDGIEVKQGSFGNLIAENWVHDTQYPCILVYGTAGNAANVIERNVCYRSQDNVMQVQGEAIVRNNLLAAGWNAFYSHDHQGQTENLVVVHNTMLNTGNGADLKNWNGREGMVFANNVVYSESSTSIRFSGGSDGVAISGNVVVGAVWNAAAGFFAGTGLADFEDAAFDASALDATPLADSAIVGAGDPAFGVAADLCGLPQSEPPDAGAAVREP